MRTEFYDSANEALDLHPGEITEDFNLEWTFVGHLV